MSGFQEYFGETHKKVCQTVRKFVEREIKPFVDEWEQKGEFPKELYRKAGEARKGLFEERNEHHCKEQLGSWIVPWPDLPFFSDHKGVSLRLFSDRFHLQ